MTRGTLHSLLYLAAIAAGGTVGCGGSAGTTVGTPSPSPAASLSFAALTFASTNVGSTSAAQPVTLSSTGSASLSITSIAAIGDFGETNNCPAVLPSGATCTIQVTFTPTLGGARSGTLSVNDNASGSPQSASLTGSGVVAGSGGLASTYFAITTNALNSGSSWPVPVPFGTSGKASSGSYWFNIETARGTYNWTPLDNIVNSANNAGVHTIDYCFFDTPQWASSNPTQSCSATANTGALGCAAPPANIQDWNDFVTAVATRYKGKIQYYEIWNEPDVISEWSGTIAQMVTLAQSARAIIKSIDPGAIVLTPSVSVGGVLSSNPNCGTSTCWLAGYLAAGGAALADGVTFHGKACDSTTGLCVNNNIACPANALQQCAGSPLIQQISDARAIMANNGLSSLPLINSEGGYSAEAAMNDLPTATADQQSAYVSRFYIVQASEGLPIAVWFSWLAPSTYPFTGFGTTAAETENNQAYQQTYNWLLGATMGGACAPDVNGVWTCPLKVASGSNALIVWSDAATSYSPGTKFTSYQSLNGTTSLISGGVVPVGILPVLLQ